MSKTFRRTGPLFALVSLAVGGVTTNGASAQSCVEVDTVQITGVTLLDESALQDGFPDELGCIGLDGLNALLEQVTFSYLDAGYVAARAYLPEQDLSDGVLEIAVIEGTVSDLVVVENGVSAPGRGASAFPGIIGPPLLLRDLEQGLAQINRLPSSDARSELVPGAETGDTIVAVEIVQDRPWRATITANNRGSSTTGENNFGFTLSYDDLFGVNDQWLLSYQRSMEPTPLAFGPDSPVGNSYSLSGSVPYGYWTFGLALSASDYLIEIPGVTGPIESSGNSRSVRLSAERLLAISESGRWDAGLALRWTDNENEILGTRIDTSSRRLTVLDAYLRHGRVLWGGQFDATFTLRNGLDLFGAFDDDNAPAGSPIAQYTALLVDASFQRQWQIGDHTLALSSQFAAQHSNQNLFGSEQFAIGGFSSIRGSRTNLLFGNSGMELVNTASLPAAIPLGEDAAITPYIGFDIGHVFPQSEFGIGGGTLMSYTAGFTISNSGFNVDAYYSDILAAPRAAQAPSDGLFTLQASIRF